MGSRNRKFEEYNKGRIQGLEMAFRLLRDAGETKAAGLVADEIKKRGKLSVQLPLTSKEVIQGVQPMKWCLYETFMCMTIEVLHTRFGFGSKRCKEFLKWWNIKVGMMDDKLVTWQEYIEAIKEEVGIDIPTDCMKEEGLIP